MKFGKYFSPLLILLVWTIFPCELSAQKTTEEVFDEAAELMYRQEFLKAADAFRQVQDIAEADHNHGYYMLSVEAEGSCYYALHLVSALQQTISKGQGYYNQYVYSVNDSTRWRWLIILNKLKGCYKFCMDEVDSQACTAAKEAFQTCFYNIKKLKQSTRFDDDALEISIRRELLSLLYKQKQYENAHKEAQAIYSFYNDIGYDERAVTQEAKQFNRNFMDATISYAVVLARCHRYEEATAALSHLPDQCAKDPAVLRTKGKILMLQYEDGGPDMRQQSLSYYNDYIRIKKQELQTHLASMTEIQREQYWLNMHDFLYDCCRLMDYAPDMIYDLALYCKGFLLEYNQPAAKTCTWKDVQKRLQKGECAIEFLQYNGKNDKKQLAALVVTPNCPKPQFVNIVDVDKLMKYKLSGGMSLGEALISTVGIDKNPIYNNAYLPDIIWNKSLLDAIGAATKIYFAADGILHQLAIEYMIPDSTLNCRRLTTTRRLLDNRKPLNQKKMLLFGGVDYQAILNANTSDNDEYAYLFMRPYADYLSYLPGTQSEINNILENRENEQDMKIEGANATDSSFQALANHFPIVHVATHGYFCGEVEDGSRLKTVLNDNSMSQSGLVFSGARYSLRDPSHDPLSPDGLLSAKEIAKIPLDSVELLVLSACQTGLGYITADGVYGIQRALKQAGVKAMIVSLWNVDDSATSLLMSKFYKNLKEDENGDVHEAFMKARQQLMTEVKVCIFQPGSLHCKLFNKYEAPRYSNAFILIDIP